MYGTQGNYGSPAPSAGGWLQPSDHAQPSQVGFAEEPNPQALSEADQWEQVGMAMSPARSPGLGLPPRGQAQAAQPMAAVFKQVLTPALQGTSKMPVVSDLSTYYVKAAGEKGPLSFEEHQKQMVVVDTALNTMVGELGVNLKNISETVKRFMTFVDACNRRIVQFTEAILDKAARDPASLQPADVPKANALIGFAQNAVQAMHATSNMALDLIDKASDKITQKTQAAIVVIFDARKKEVELFTEKLKVFHMQENHELEKMLKFQKARLEEQQQIFTQMKEVVQLELEHQKTLHSQEQERTKAAREFQVQVMGLKIKEEEVQFRHEVEKMSAERKADRDDRVVEVNKELEEKRLDDDKEVKITAIGADERSRVWEAAQDTEARKWEAAQAAEAQKWTASQDTIARQTESAHQRDVGIVGAVSKAASPTGCSVM